MPNENTRPNASWTSREAYLLALVSLTLGLLLGYALRGSAPVPVTAGTTAGGASETNTVPTAESLQPLAAPLLGVLKAKPNDVETLVQLGNLYYDHRVYPQAIEYYTRALELRPNDIDVHTDLGTAFWYAGLPEKAVAEYQKSLAVDPAHPNTLFNLGVVRAEGLKDYNGAIAAWETLLKTNPQYPEKQRVLEQIAQARNTKP